jgi:hypothetical protein
MKNFIIALALLVMLFACAPSAQACSGRSCGRGGHGIWFPGKAIARGTARVVAAPFRGVSRAAHRGCATCNQ